MWCNTFRLKQGCGAILLALGTFLNKGVGAILLDLNKGVVQYFGLKQLVWCNTLGLNKGVVQYFWT